MKKANRAKTAVNKSRIPKRIRRRRSRKIPVKKRQVSRVRHVGSDRVWLISLAIGIIVFFSGLVIKAHEAAKLSFNADAVSLNLVKQTGARPTRILIPAIDVNLPVYETGVVRGVWQISPDGVSHLAASSVPGRNGNIIMYGHNSRTRLGRLAEVSVGDRVVVTTDEGNDRLYLVEKVTVVRPEDLTVVENTPTETLTLYTCTGFADSKRLVVIARPFGIPVADVK